MLVVNEIRTVKYHVLHPEAVNSSRHWNTIPMNVPLFTESSLMAAIELAFSHFNGLHPDAPKSSF